MERLEALFRRLQGTPLTGPAAIVEILLLALLLYVVLRFLRGSRGAGVMRGMLVLAGFSIFIVFIAARLLQLEHIVIVQRILLEPRELVEESHAADPLAEKTAQHAVLRPDVAVFRGDVLHDIVGGGADDVFGGVGVRLGSAGGADVLLEELDGVGHNLHQVGE